MPTLDVLALTPNPTVDKNSTIDRVAPEIKLRCDQPFFEPGGGGVNVARVLERLEVNVRLLYPAGGPQGRFLQKLLNEEGLDHQSVPIEKITRESFTVRETSTNQQYRFNHPGPELDPTEWDLVLEQVQEALEHGASYAVGSGSLPPGVPPDQYSEIGRRVRKEESRFVLDTSGDYLQKSLDGQPFLIKPNLRELGYVAGHELESDEDVVEICRALVEDERAEHVVVSRGAGGAFLIDMDHELRYRAPTVNIDSKVGAGDSMVGGILFGLLETDSVSEAVRYGVAAGTAAVKTPGTELCHPNDVKELYDRVGVTQVTRE